MKKKIFQNINFISILKKKLPITGEVRITRKIYQRDAKTDEWT